MASRQNKMAREEGGGRMRRSQVPSYGAPTGPPPTPDPERERQRQEKLKKKPTAEERREAIEESERAGRAETRRRREDRRRTEAQTPATTGIDTEGRSTTELLEERGRDVEDVLTEMETGEPRPERETAVERRRRETAEEEAAKPKPGSPARPIGAPVGGTSRPTNRRR